MNEKNMKKILKKAYKEEKMAENEKLKRAFMTSAVALVVVGIIFVATMTIVLGQLTKATVGSKANMYDLNCLTEPVEKPLTECRE